MMKSIKAIALDFDGVLTDGTSWWGPNGEEWKKFSLLDSAGISLGQSAGLVFALISEGICLLVDRYATEMSITDVFKNAKDKGAALAAFAMWRGFDLETICYLGDDVSDLSAMKIAGLAAAPATAHPTAIAAAAIVTRSPGGGGAVRELVDLWLAEHAPDAGVASSPVEPA